MPSSPESVSDEDNQSKARPWYVADYTPEQLGVAPKRPCPKKTQFWCVSPIRHDPGPNPNPGPIDPTERANEQRRIERRLKALERKEAKEEKKEQEREEEREAKRQRRRIRQFWDEQDNRMREVNGRARDKRALALRAAEWTAPAPPPA